MGFSKQCTKCGEIKWWYKFSLSRTTHSKGIFSLVCSCKTCQAKIAKKYYSDPKNREKNRQYKRKDKERKNLLQKERRERIRRIMGDVEYKKMNAEQARERRRKNPERARERQREWQRKNKDKMKIYQATAAKKNKKKYYKDEEYRQKTLIIVRKSGAKFREKLRKDPERHMKFKKDLLDRYHAEREVINIARRLKITLAEARGLLILNLSQIKGEAK
jgi:hypothetical protein